VGREHEIAQLRERWQQCLSGIGKGIAIIGEAGVGKSRLAKELLVEASAAGRCIELICTRESQTRPFHPIIELLNQLINPTGDKDPDSRLIGLEKLLLNHGISLTNGVSLLAPLLSLDPKKYVSVLDVSLERVREQTLETLVDLLLEFARNTPLLLLVEDIHWADASTLDFLEKLVGCASDSSLLVLLTARKELRSISPAIWQIALEPLTRVAVKAMLEQMLATTVPESLTDEVTARTGGICLFVEELGSSLLASAAKSGISVENGLEHLPEILIPLRLRDLLTMRLDEVGNARIIAQLAAVIGREFPLDLLAEISKLPKETLLAELKVLLDAELIRERGRSSARQYAFRHALIRDAAYDGLVTSSRSSAHSDIADALTRNIDETKQRPELIAYHLSKAGRYVSAIEFAIKATEQACMRSANEEARSIVSKAEEWLLQVDDENERARLELSLNAIALPVLMACWRWTEDAVRLKSERSLELLKKTQSSPEQARVLWALSMYYMVLADREKCRTVAEQQLALAKQLSDDGMQAAALNSFSGTLMDEGKFSEALRVAESSLGLFDPVAHANHCQSYGLHTGSIARDFRALALCHLGRFQASLVEAELAEQDAIRAGHSASYVLAVFYRALLATLLEDRKLAHSFCKTGIRLAEEHGHRAQLGYFACLDAWAKGELNAMRSSVKTMEDWGQGLGLPFYQSLLAEVEAEHGDPKQALEIIQRSIVRSKDTGNVSFLSASLAVEGTHRLTVAPQAVDEAEKLFREAIAIARSQSALLQELKAVRRLANFLLNCGRDKEALTLLNDYCERLKEEPNVPVVEHLRTLKRFCTTNRNQLVTSQSQFAECAARGMPPSEGSS
jgi:tetratricopeptide (TPR) repeat protein